MGSPAICPSPSQTAPRCPTLGRPARTGSAILRAGRVLVWTTIRCATLAQATLSWGMTWGCFLTLRLHTPAAVCFSVGDVCPFSLTKMDTVVQTLLVMIRHNVTRQIKSTGKDRQRVTSGSSLPGGQMQTWTCAGISLPPTTSSPDTCHPPHADLTVPGNE